MGEILGVYLMPHPPIIIPEVGRGEEQKIEQTANALKVCSEEIKSKVPDTVILITPHGPVFEDAIAIMTEEKLKGDFSRFGAARVSMTFDNNLELVRDIMTEADRRDILCIGIDRKLSLEYRISSSLDWGALVPLYFVTRQFKDFKLVHISIAMLSYEELYAFGKVIQEVVESRQNNVVVIASGDLSHRLKEDGPYGFHPMGPELDRNIVGLLKDGNVEGLFRLDPNMVAEGGECGLRSIIIGLGTLDGYRLNTRVLSYEGPFGVGYCVAAFEGSGIDKDRELVEELFNYRYRKMEEIRRKEDPYVSLARYALEKYVKENKIIRTKELEGKLPDEMLKKRAGVFVSIKKHGRLRGCIGTIQPTRRNIAEEIIHNAISAGVRDPRFVPVGPEELKDLVYSVDVLKEPVPVKSIDELDARKYGVIVRKGGRCGLLLPDLEGVDTPKQQIEIALKKAGIDPDEDYKIERFEVERHKIG